MTKKETNDSNKEIISLLQQLLAIELWRAGLSQAEIAKRLGVSTGSANKILKGLDKKLIV